MITARLLAVLAASSLAGTALAQTQSAPSNPPNAAPGYNTAHPHQREMKSVGGNEAASPGSRPAPGSGLTTPGAAPGTARTSQRSHREGLRMAETGPAGHPWASMSVESPSGESLGSVSQVVPGLNGRKSSGYVLVSAANGMSVPVPYRAAAHRVRHGKLVLSSQRLDRAPKVTQEDLQNRADHAWRVKADRYWKAHGGRRMRK